jgi:hypothetical protein
MMMTTIPAFPAQQQSPAAVATSVNDATSNNSATLATGGVGAPLPPSEVLSSARLAKHGNAIKGREKSFVPAKDAAWIIELCSG